MYVDLSHLPKKSKNERIHQENNATVYAGNDHIKRSAMSDSRSQQENEFKLIDWQGDISRTVSTLFNTKWLMQALLYASLDNIIKYSKLKEASCMNVNET